MPVFSKPHLLNAPIAFSLARTCIQMSWIHTSVVSCDAHTPTRKYHINSWQKKKKMAGLIKAWGWRAKWWRKRAGKVRVSGVIRVLSSWAVFTFSQYRFSFHLLPIIRIDTLHSQRCRRRHVSMWVRQLTKVKRMELEISLGYIWHSITFCLTLCSTGFRAYVL